jgi:hypothetical protein
MVKVGLLHNPHTEWAVLVQILLLVHECFDIPKHPKVVRGRLLSGLSGFESLLARTYVCIVNPSNS